MTVTIELRPETEELVKNEAAVRGIPVEDYLESVIESQLTPGQIGPYLENITPADRALAWEAWAASHSMDTPVILDDSRDAIYRDDGR